MASLISEDFEGGTAGAALTTSNTSVTAFGVLGSWVFTDSSPAEGDLAARFTVTAQTGRAAFSFPSGSVSEAAVDLFVRTDNVTTTRPFASFGEATVNRAQLRVMSTGILQIRNNVTAVAETNVTVTAGQWFRVAWRLAGSEQRLRVYTAAPYNSVTEEVSGVYSAGTVDEFRIGADQSVTAVTDFDSIISDDAGWPVRPGGPEPDWSGSNRRIVIT